MSYGSFRKWPYPPRIEKNNLRMFFFNFNLQLYFHCCRWCKSGSPSLVWKKSLKTNILASMCTKGNILLLLHCGEFSFSLAEWGIWVVWKLRNKQTTKHGGLKYNYYKLITTAAIFDYYFIKVIITLSYILYAVN